MDNRSVRQALKASVIVLEYAKYNRFLSLEGGFGEFVREGQSIRRGTTGAQRDSRRVH